MSGSEYSHGDLASIGDYITPGQPKTQSMAVWTQEVRLPNERTENLLQLHDGGIGPHPLMHGVLLARVAGIEELGILIIVVVRHDGEREGLWSSGGRGEGVGEGKGCRLAN